MQAIETFYLGPTDHRGSRVKAKCDGGSMTLEWDDALNIEENHRAAAEALARSLGRTGKFYGRLVSGSLAGRGYCHVFTGRP